MIKILQYLKNAVAPAASQPSWKAGAKQSILSQALVQCSPLRQFKHAEKDVVAQRILSAFDNDAPRTASLLQPIFLQRAGIEDSAHALSIGRKNMALDNYTSALPFFELAFSAGALRHAADLQSLSYLYTRHGRLEEARQVLQPLSEKLESIEALKNELGNIHLISATAQESAREFDRHKMQAIYWYQAALPSSKHQDEISENLSIANASFFGPEFGDVHKYLPTLKQGSPVPIKSAMLAALKKNAWEAKVQPGVALGEHLYVTKDGHVGYFPAVVYHELREENTALIELISKEPFDSSVKHRDGDS